MRYINLYNEALASKNLQTMISFSIITCTFNAQDVLQRTLDSVAQQTYKNIEHLIIDGVSRDETLSMAHAYEAKISSSSEPYSIKNCV